MKQLVEKDYRSPVTIDWSMNMANSIAGQILNNEHCKKDYVYILAIATLKIVDALRYENDNN